MVFEPQGLLNPIKSIPPSSCEWGPNFPRATIFDQAKWPGWSIPHGSPKRNFWIENCKRKPLLIREASMLVEWSAGGEFSARDNFRSAEQSPDKHRETKAFRKWKMWVLQFCTKNVQNCNRNCYFWISQREKKSMFPLSSMQTFLSFCTIFVQNWKKLATFKGFQSFWGGLEVENSCFPLVLKGFGRHWP